MAKKKLEWTPARRHSFIVSVLRTGTRRWPAKYQALEKAKTEKKINVRSGRMAQHYLCAMCKEEYSSTGVQVDHITPVVGEEGFVSWDLYVERLFCEASNFQILCVTCHSIKTAKERGYERNPN
jgi:5-methylcytosine-specific restriction endonuclease McrA